MDAVYFEQFTANKFGNSHRGSAKREVAHLFAGRRSRVPASGPVCSRTGRVLASDLLCMAGNGG